MAELGRTGKDCVVVALANFTKREYDEILVLLYENVSTNAFVENHYKNGFREATYVKVYEALIGRKAIIRKPRRGQEHLTGLAAMRRPGNKKGHLVMIIAGLVFDVDGSITPIAAYRAKTGMGIRAIWV